MAAKYKCFPSNPSFKVFSYLLDMTVLPTTVKHIQLYYHPYSSHTLTHFSPYLSSSLHRELPLPSLHPSLTSHTPPTLCQLTPEHGHIAMPFDPLPAMSGNTGPEARGFSISLSQGRVAQVCDRWASVSGSDPPCCGTHSDGVREH